MSCHLSNVNIPCSIVKTRSLKIENKFYIVRRKFIWRFSLLRLRLPFNKRLYHIPIAVQILSDYFNVQRCLWLTVSTLTILSHEAKNLAKKRNKWVFNKLFLDRKPTCGRVPVIGVLELPQKRIPEVLCILRPSEVAGEPAATEQSCRGTLEISC